MKFLTITFFLFLGFWGSLHGEEYWFEGDYLLWATKKAPIPVPLVTLASLDDPLPGAINQPGTKVLLGNEKIDMGCQSGFRVACGTWLDLREGCGLEGSFFFLPEKTFERSLFTSGEPGSLNLAVPIFDILGLFGLNGVPGETIFILPGPIEGPGFSGLFSLKMSERFMGARFDTLVNWVCKECFRFDWAFGFRWLQLQESLKFIGRTAALPGSSETGFYNFEDSFKTTNNFYGLQIGIKTEYQLSNRLIFNGFVAESFGCTDQLVKINGSSQTSNGNLFYKTLNTGNDILGGGIFSEPTNIGSHRRDDFGFLLEVGMHFTYLFSSCIEGIIGYNLLWLDPVSRPGNQIDRKINPTRTALAEASRDSVGIGPDQPVPFGTSAAAPLPRGANRPEFKHHTTNFWAQGLIIGLKYRY